MIVKQVNCKIESLSPLLMNRFPMEVIEGFAKLTKEEQAEHSTYRDEKEKLFVPGTNVRSCFINAAKFTKGKGRASLKTDAAACLMVTPEYVYLNQDEYVIDSRRVVVPATKGGIIRHRPMFEKWELEFNIEYDQSLISAKQLREIVDNAGTRVGLLDFRPQRSGSFGRFIVTSWKK